MRLLIFKESIMTKHIKDKKLSTATEKHDAKDIKTTHPGYQGTHKKAAQINTAHDKTEHRSGNHLDEEEYNKRK